MKNEKEEQSLRRTRKKKDNIKARSCIGRYRLVQSKVIVVEYFQ
jgi:hypothetical protein